MCRPVKKQTHPTKVIARPALALTMPLALALAMAVMMITALPAAAFNPSQVSLAAEGVSLSGIRLAAPGAEIVARLNLRAGSSHGMVIEQWLILTGPTGTDLFYNGSTWEAEPQALATGPLADKSLKVSSPPLNQIGLYRLRFQVDGLINSSPDEPALLDVLEIRVTGEPAAQIPVSPDLKISQSPAEGLTIKLAPGGYTGRIIELWLMAQSPAGARLFHNGRAWGAEPRPYSQTALAAKETALPLPGSLTPGVWIFTLALDAKADGLFAPSIQSRTRLTAPGEKPSLSIWTTTETVTHSSSVELELDIWSGGYAGIETELWLVAQAPDGQWWHYNAASAAWQETPTAYAAGPLTDATPTAISSPPLSARGVWLFWWGFDDNPNGEADGFNFFARVEVEVTG